MINKLYILLITILFNSFTLSNLCAEPIVEKIDANNFPTIQIYLRESNQKYLGVKNAIQITEVMKGYTRAVSKVNLSKTNNLRPVRLIISIQASTWENNKSSGIIAESLINSLESYDRLSLHVYSNETVFWNPDISTKSAIEKINTMTIGSKNKFQPNINALLDSMNEDNLPSYLLIICPEKPIGNFSALDSLLTKSKRRNIQLNIAGMEDKTLVAIASITAGNFFLINDRMSLTRIQNDFFLIRKPAYIIEYTTPFEDWEDVLQQAEIQSNLKIGSKNIEFTYNVSLANILKARFSNVEFFYSITTAILLMALLSLYGVHKRNEKIKNENFMKKQEEIHKADLYYHENKSYETSKKVALVNNKYTDEDSFSEDDDLNIDADDSTYEDINAIETTKPKYEKVFLILKEGPHPGRQFTIHKAEINIGSSPSNDLVLLDSTISSKHAKIKKINSSYYIYDLISQRGIFLNGKRLLKPKTLNDFDEIRLGKALLIFRGK